MRKRIATVAVGAVLATTPAAAQSKNDASHGYERAIHSALEHGKYDPYEERYLRLYNTFADEFGVGEVGRNIVLFGALTDKGAHKASKEQVVGDAESMATALNPPEPATTAAPTTTESTTTTTTTGGAASSSSTAQCESGGDYGAVNPAGYYGAYQFDQGTWDAYAPSGYQGTNPASAPPAVQDQAAASVPYDAWPNC